MTEYKVVLLCFCDWSHTVTHGKKLIDSNANKNIVSLKQLRAEKDKVAVRLEVYIIRACFLLLSPKFILD